MPIERIVPNTPEWEAFYSNHISRYKFATNFLKTSKINSLLDIACGVGYGTKHLLETKAEQIIGADISDEALKIARQHFSDKNITFIKDDCNTMSVSAQYGRFDAIISFETLEHLKNPKLFLENVILNLNPGGTFITSTPNSCVSSPDGVINWHFHEKEYTPEEFVQLLNSAGFSNTQIYGQQLTEIGKLREQVRHELFQIRSNPFFRLGKWVQEKFRKRKFSVVLPEQENDFKIVSYNSEKQISDLKNQGPFVLLIVAVK